VYTEGESDDDQQLQEEKKVVVLKIGKAKLQQWTALMEAKAARNRPLNLAAGGMRLDFGRAGYV
jgi:hypothetical protein